MTTSKFTTRNSRRCSKCHVRKFLTDFYTNSTNRGGYMLHCKKCQYLMKKERINSDHRFRLWTSSNSNAKTKGLNFSIKITDIKLPVCCKYLGVRLNYNRTAERGRLRTWDAPSIDRIDPTRGYVPGNIQVISDLANRMKQNATVEQLLAFAEGILRVHGGG